MQYNLAVEATTYTAQTPRLSLHKFEVAQAINQGELGVHMSELMGCDYIFVSHIGDHALLQAGTLALSIQELIDILESTPLQTRVILVDLTKKQPEFSCCEYVRNKGRVISASKELVTNPEQIAFFQLIYECAQTY